MSTRTARRAIIIGGGASGTLLAYQLLRNPSSAFRVTLIEKRSDIGRGVAYSTVRNEHLLNVHAANMSALPDDPDHFWRWLSAREEHRPFSPDRHCFVPRRIYGEYITSLIEAHASNVKSCGRLTILRKECVEVTETASCVSVTLRDGTWLAGDVAILATGHEQAIPRSSCRVDPGGDLWGDPWVDSWGDRSAPSSAHAIDKDATVLIVGTGLTMVDYVSSLLCGGHRGPVIAMSRRGLIPNAHRRVAAMRIKEADVPFGASATYLLRWFRGRIERHVAQGGDWRSVVDAVRPFTQRLWRQLPLDSRRRFLRHAGAWWDVHRHRMAPEAEDRIKDARTDASLSLLAAKITAIEPNAGGALVRYRRRGRSETESLQVGKIVDCTGIARDPRATANPAVRSLFDQGLTRTDPLRIGLDVASNCALINQDGSPSERLFAIGPLTRAAFWEIIAIPDIRNQCAELAAHLVRSYCSVAQGPWQSVPETADQPIASQDPIASQNIVSAHS
jgi:uncharacterized NAD(P)/FAD-binding protein YdhS